MKKRGYLLLFLLILSFQFSLSFSEDFTGLKYADEEFELGDDTFTLKLSRDETSLIFENTHEKILLGVDRCKATIFYKYCFYNTIIDLEEGIGRISYHTDRDIPAINISIISLIPDLSITRTVSSTTPNEFEDVIVDILIKNDGKKKANVVYEELIESPAILLICVRCAKIGNKVVFQSLLYPNDEDTFSYKINPQDAGTVTLLPNITYTSETLNGSFSTSSITITPKKTFLLTYTGDSALTVEKTYTTEISIKNSDLNENLEYTSTLRFNDNLLFSFDHQNFNSDKKTITFSGKLDSMEEEKYTVYVLGKKSGSEAINIWNDYTLGSEKLNTNQTLNFNIKVEKPNFILSYNKMMFSDTNNNIQFSIDNSNTKNSFQNIKVNIVVGDEINETFFIPFLKFTRNIDAYDTNFTLIANDTRTFNIKVTVEYETLFNEKLTHVINNQITIKPIASTFTVSHELNDFLGNKADLIVTAYVTNNDNDNRIINVSEEILDAEVLSFQGNTLDNYKKITQNNNNVIMASAKRKAFTYSLKREGNKTARIYTLIHFKGLKNTYLINKTFILDFDEKIANLKEENVRILSTNSFEKKSGVLLDKIELEENYEYEIEAAKGDDNKGEDAAQEDIDIKETEPIVPDNNIKKKETIWDKIKKIIGFIFDF